MGYKVKLTEEAQHDLATLDMSLKRKAAKALRKLEHSPDYGEPLGNRYGMNLSGYYRLRFNNRKHRIIYIVENDNEVIVIAIGPRGDFDVYGKAHTRI